MTFLANKVANTQAKVNWATQTNMIRRRCAILQSALRYAWQHQHKRVHDARTGYRNGDRKACLPGQWRSSGSAPAHPKIHRHTLVNCSAGFSTSTLVVGCKSRHEVGHEDRKRLATRTGMRLVATTARGWPRGPHGHLFFGLSLTPVREVPPTSFPFSRGCWVRPYQLPECSEAS